MRHKMSIIEDEFIKFGATTLPFGFGGNGLSRSEIKVRGDAVL